MALHPLKEVSFQNHTIVCLFVIYQVRMLHKVSLVFKHVLKHILWNWNDQISCH